MNQNQNSNQSQTIANPKTQQLNKTPQMNDRDCLALITILILVHV